MENYLFKHALYPKFITEKPCKNLQMIVVIPCYNEPDLLATLQSLYNCTNPGFLIEVIIVINSAENSPENIIHANLITLNEINNWKTGIDKTRGIYFHSIIVDNLPRKYAGVGLARKIGMDEAVRRFCKAGNPDGIIVSFDADSVCDDNYFTEISKHYTKQRDSTGCTIYFEHCIEGYVFQAEVYKRVAEYELYLRYYKHAMQHSGFPYSIYTIGSCFTIKASTYAKQGGMNRRKAGEDFYFLHKIAPLGNFYSINTTRVIPSSRPSDRVPFGTGTVISKLIADNKELLVYNPGAFEVLELLFSNTQKFYNAAENDIQVFLKTIPGVLSEFLKANHFGEALVEINNNSASYNTFCRRFYNNFNAFRALKFLNYAHEKTFNKIPVTKAAKVSLEKLIQTGISEDLSVRDLLLKYRDIDKKYRE